MDRTSEPTGSTTTDEEECHSACQSQSSTGLAIPRGVTLSLGSLASHRTTRELNQASQLTLSCLIEQIRNICSGSQDGLIAGACPRPSLRSILHRHLPVSRFRPGVPYVVQRSSLPQNWSTNRLASSSSQSMPALTYTASDGAGDHSEANIDLMMRQYEDCILYMLRLLDHFLEGSRSLMISEANQRVNFRLVNEENSNRFRNQSLVFYVNQRQDRYRDMRLDVDNMSYEELLALEDRIGYVTTGMSDDVVANSLKHTKYFVLARESSQEESCTICQEEYVEEDDLGSLDCGHGFHAGCIKQWLRYKNQCPVCKSTGLGMKNLQLQNL